MSDFNVKDFIAENLARGIEDGTFTQAQANMLAVNYYSRGALNDADLQQIDEAGKAIVAERAQRIAMQAQADEQSRIRDADMANVNPDLEQGIELNGHRPGVLENKID